MRRLILICLLALLPVTAHAQLPTRLVQAADLEHLGYFTLPETPSNDQECFVFQYPGALGFNPASNSLFVSGLDWYQHVGEVNIPSSLGANVTATVRQSCRDVTGGRLSQFAGDAKIGGLYVSGDRLIVSAFSYYDADFSARYTHLVRPVNTSSTSGIVGPFRIGSAPVATLAGYMGPIPAVWQSALKGDLLTGQCCLSIVTRTSFGPAVSATTAAGIIAQKASVTTLLYYPDGAPLVPYGASGTNLLWNGTTRIRGVVLPPDTASVLFFGHHGWGSYCYGTCGTDVQGEHAPPYYPTVWAYDARELAQVAAGSRASSSVRPYAMWRLPSVITSSQIAGAVIDPSTGRIYVLENRYGDRGRVHVFRVRGAGTEPPQQPPTPPTEPDPPAPPPPPPPTEPTPPAPPTTPQGWTLAWADEFDGTALNASDWNIENSTTGSYGGTRQAWRPANVTVGNGVLRLTARRESAGNRQYTSGAVNTRSKRTFGPTFRLEVRASIPAFQGGWPAIWTREGTMPNPDVGVELDIMENIGDPNLVYQVQHGWNLDGQPHQQYVYCELGGQRYAGQMHVYAVEVLNGRTRWFIDGQETCGPSDVTPKQASHLLLNLSIGGEWPGDPPSSGGAWPQHFDIDYVRVYTRGSTPQPPPRVDAVVSDWSAWQPIGPWSPCVPADSGTGGVQTRTEERTRTVITPASGGGTTPPLRETRTASQSCALPPPPPPADPCVAQPGVLSVSSWPSSAEGSRQLRYSYSVAGVVTTVTAITIDLTAGRVRVTDARGCTVEARR